MLERGVGVRVDGDEIAAEPVPVRRPGVCVIGVDVREAGVRSTGCDTGSKKIGLNLAKGGLA